MHFIKKISKNTSQFHGQYQCISAKPVQIHTETPLIPNPSSCSSPLVRESVCYSLMIVTFSCSRDVLTGKCMAKFNNFDANNDQVLVPDEFKAWFKQYDSDGKL